MFTVVVAIMWSKYKFGVLERDVPSFTLNSKLYLVLVDESTVADAVTFLPSKNCEWELHGERFLLEAGQCYFLKPPPPQPLDPSFRVNRFLKAVKIIENDALMSHMPAEAKREFVDAVRETIEKKKLLYDSVKTFIGSKKLKMTCWPFTILSLSHFLKHYDIPHKIVVGAGQNEDAGQLFCDCNLLKKRIQTRTERAYIVFNPHVKGRADEVVGEGFDRCVETIF